MLKTLTIKQWLTPYAYTKGVNKRNDYIVIHYFGGLGSAESSASWAHNPQCKGTAQYYLDESPIVQQCVRDEDISWNCGDTNSPTGTMRSLVKNSNSIAIEMRPYKLDPSTASSALCNDWYFTDKTVENLVELTLHLIDKWKIPLDHVVRHYDASGKWCPRPWMGDDINKYYGTSGNDQWKKFKERLEEGLVTRYNTVAEIPKQYQPSIKALMDANIIRGNGAPKDKDGYPTDIDHSLDMIRMAIECGRMTGILK